MPSPRLLMLGPPGAGKGTQSSTIARSYDIEHVTTGDALRNNKEMDISDMDTEYDTPGEYMAAGDLVPDEVVTAIVEQALSRTDGFVLDGYPRTIAQADELDGMTDLDLVLSLSVNKDVLVERLTGRRVDPETGENYHVDFNIPDDETVRDRLVQREDDNETSVRHRLDVFDERTRPVVERYADHDGFVEIDGNQPPEAVNGDIENAIDTQLSTSE